MGAITVITSGKGGVGKSTTTVGLACALSRRGRRVLLIDGDAGLRSLDRMLGVESSLVYDISDVAAGRCEPIRAIYPCPGFNGLFLLPAPGKEDNIIPPEIMRQLVPLLASYYDHVLVDSPAGVGLGFLSAIAAAQRVTAGTLTTAVSLLERKGYLERRRDAYDKRVVRILPTEKARQANREHERFHEELVDYILSSLSQEEAQVFVRALGRVDGFLQEKAAASCRTAEQAAPPAAMEQMREKSGTL